MLIIFTLFSKVVIIKQDINKVDISIIIAKERKSKMMKQEQQQKNNRIVLFIQ